MNFKAKRESKQIKIENKSIAQKSMETVQEPILRRKKPYAKWEISETILLDRPMKSILKDI